MEIPSYHKKSIIIYPVPTELIPRHIPNHRVKTRRYNILSFLSELKGGQVFNLFYAGFCSGHGCSGAFIGCGSWPEKGFVESLTPGLKAGAIETHGDLKRN